MNDLAPPPRPRAFSLELLLVVGLPLVTLVAGAIMLSLAFGQGFTPITPPDPVKLHGS
jgi:hypothetical protein